MKPAKALETLQSIASEFPDCDLIENEKDNLRSMDIDNSAIFMYHKGLALGSLGDKKKAILYFTVCIFRIEVTFLESS